MNKQMSDRLKIKLQQTTHALGILAYNHRLLIDNTVEDDLFILLKQYIEQRQIVKQLENQLKTVTLKTKSQSQQIQDQRQRRLNSTHRATRLHKTIQQIYDIINYRGQHTSPIDQLHYIKKLCEDRLRDDILSEDEDEDELDSRNCTIDDDQNESIIIHPRVVLPQSSTKKRSLNQDDNNIMSPPKRLRYEESRQIMNPISQRIIAQTTFECFTSAENTTRPFTVSTDIKMMDNSCNDQSSCLTINNDNTLSSSSINNSTKTTSSSSIEQTLSMTPTKISTTAHRFASRKIFKPETCFVCIKRINFGSVSYRCSYCSQSCHVNCKENAGSNCKTLSNNAMLPPHSPKISTITTLKNTHRQRLTNSEPRKAGISSIHTSTIQRRLPFDGMMSHKSSSKYIPSV
ncbi:unnamed protein product [Adineta steineri]|uniref:Phorbol-ester/DAG-type domain-containing protein n=1 Tax=Adineta steineri TaxID=433720 RepID=A0A819CBR2_9BILA|nr:unnamed protein product [Adineta steineri]CAF3812111.1 unnamed protein product [Adineta steineri]